MRSSALTRRFLEPRAILIALVFALAWEPATARAGCGDHVRVPTEGINAHSPDLTRSLPHRLPCTGPECSRRPALPPLTTAEPTTAPETWGCLTAPFTDTPAGHGSLLGFTEPS